MNEYSTSGDFQTVPRRSGRDEENDAANSFEQTFTVPWPNRNEIKLDQAGEITKEEKKPIAAPRLFDPWPDSFEDSEGDHYGNENDPESPTRQGNESEEDEMGDSPQQPRVEPSSRVASPGAFRVPGTDSQEGEEEDSMFQFDNEQQEDDVLEYDAAPFPVTTAQLVDRDEANRLSDVEDAVRQLQKARENAAVAQVVAQDSTNRRSRIAREILNRTRGKRLKIIIVTMVILVAVLVSLVVVLRRDDEQSLTALVASASPDGGKALQDLLSPQHRALVWLQNNEALCNYTDARKIQRYSLATLFYSTLGFNWTRKDGWLTNDNECKWEFRCENETICEDTDALLRICLPSNNLEGTVPPEVAMLSDSLVWLSFSRNKLLSTLPREIALLTNLEYVSFRSNALTGSIPTEISSLTNLVALRLFSNRLSGTIPSELSLLSNLDTIRLQSNQLTGTIPTEIALLAMLEDLRLHFNALTGTIPSEIASMKNLTELLLYNNTLEGPFVCPDHINVCDISCSTDPGAQPNPACRIL